MPAENQGLADSDAVDAAGPDGDQSLVSRTGHLASFENGDRIRIGENSDWVTVRGAVKSEQGWDLFVEDRLGALAQHSVTVETPVDFLRADGTAASPEVLAGLWSEWMRSASQHAPATAMASSTLIAYPHQNRAVYGAMLPQPLLRFMLADEPGTGKTIMGGLWLKESQRLGFVRRALVVCPAHLVSKWQDDWSRLLGGELRSITADSVRHSALDLDHDMWIVSLHLAAANPQVQEAIHPDNAGWDAVVFDEAHRLTPSAETFYRVAEMLVSSPRALFMTATPHRGSESLFRSLMHLVDGDVFPEAGMTGHQEVDRRLKPGPIHFMRRMKEELVDIDGKTLLFKDRTAYNVEAPLNAFERSVYDEALDLVEEYFPAAAVGLAKMVYGKRAASSLFGLAETLKRRVERMGAADPNIAGVDASSDGDEAEEDFQRVIHQQSKAERAEKRASTDLRQRILDALSDDDLDISKWPRLLEDVLAKHGIVGGGDEQAVVFTEFTDTATWLVDRLRRHGFTAQQYSGRQTHADRDETRAGFMGGEFQILVSTDAGNEGIDLQAAHVLVNWDIPWSLVTLEQRMGRIHRVGQHRDVHLYNLVAIGTREGEAHHRLLDNLVAAANELGGKMFDSLELIGEIVQNQTGTSIDDILGATFLDDSRRTLAEEAVAAITTDQLRIAHESASAAGNELASKFDDSELEAALDSLQSEQLDRINPHIVERFLNRLATAGLISVNQSTMAEDGLWLIGTGSLGVLPGQLKATEGNRTLVATSGAAKRKAVQAGQAGAHRAVSLGPSEQAFRDLVALSSEQLRASLWRGGRLSDPTSVTDYSLVAFEVPVAEGNRRTQGFWSYLVRVDEVGAREVSWELLANLESTTDDSAAQLHPAHSDDASTEVIHLTDRDRTKRQANFDAWLQGTKRQLQRLPGELTREIDDPDERRETRERLKETTGQRLDTLRQACVLDIGDPRLLGWTSVEGTAVPEDPTDKDSEPIAMQHVTELLRSDGWQVADRSNERPGPGFDLHAKRGGKQRCVEVKGVWEAAASRGVRLTGNEVAKAGILGDDYWLYIVDNCQDGAGTLFHAFQDPASVFEDTVQDVAVLKIAGSALVQARAEHSA